MDLNNSNVKHLLLNIDWEPGMCLAEETTTNAVIHSKYGLITKKRGGFSIVFIYKRLNNQKSKNCSVQKELSASFEQLNLLLDDPTTSSGFVLRSASKRKCDSNDVDGIAAKSSKMEIEISGAGIDGATTTISKRKHIDGKNVNTKKIKK